MKCQFCKEDLDDRDIIDAKTLHCWKCGSRRALTEEEKEKYAPDHQYDDGDDWDSNVFYNYEV